MILSVIVAETVDDNDYKTSFETYYRTNKEKAEQVVNATIYFMNTQKWRRNGLRC